MTRIMLMFNLSLKAEYLGHLRYPFNHRKIILLEETEESWQKKVALSCL